MSVIAPPQRQIDELGLTTHPFWKANVVQDSVGPHGIRLTSLHCRFPREVLVELNTHRMLSKNASSRRAIPTTKMVQAVIDFPYFPEFKENQPGMSAGKTIGPERMKIARAVWLNAQRAMVECARQLNDLGVQKSWPAWLIQPFSFVDVIITATDWNNFFSQRIDESAQPEMQVIASLMKIALEKSKPEPIKFGQWHLPFTKPEDVEYFDGDVDKLKLVSAARCARVSYVNHNGDRDPIEDVQLGYRLLGSRPLHSCYDDTTEVLTTDGFIPFPGLSKNHSVAAVNITDMSCRFENPIAVQSYPYNGPMVSLVSQKIDTLVTPNHRLVTSRLLNNKITKTVSFSPWQFETALSVISKPRTFSPVCTVARTPGVSTETFGLSRQNFFRLLGFFIGDGSVSTGRTITFHLKKPRKISYLRGISGELFRQTASNCNVSSDGLGDFMKTCYTQDKDKRIPFRNMELSSDDVQNLFDGLRNSDGSTRKNTWVYSTCSAVLANQIQEIAATSGIHSSLSITKKDNVNHNDLIRVNFSKKTRHRFETTQRGRGYTCRAETVDYNGNVYCCTVSTGAILIRRNGKILVCGNSPFEHPAKAVNYRDLDGNPAYIGNYRGWWQYRKDLPNESGQ